MNIRPLSGTCALVLPALLFVSAQEVTFYAPSDYFNPDLSGFAVADFNGDGKTDVAVTWKRVVTVALNGAEKRTFAAGATASSDPAVADFNGDGQLDLAVTDLGGWLSVLLNDGSGGFAEPAGSVAGVAPKDPTAGDFNGDARADIALIQYGKGVSVQIGNGDGTFQLPVAVVTGEIYSIATADFTSDGVLDLAVVRNASTGGREVVVLRGRGDGTFQDASSGVPGDVDQVAIGDLNSDGKADLALTRQNQQLFVLIGNGDGTFLGPQIYGAGRDAAGEILIGDLNGDGHADAILCAGTQVNVFLNRGDGSFPASEHSIPLAAVDAVVADFNQDGKADLGVRTGSSVGIRWGLGDAMFWMAPGFVDDIYAYPVALASGDFNGDGRVDLAAAGSHHPYGYFAATALGAGNGAFNTPTILPLTDTARGPSGIYAARFDGGGLSDVVLVTVGYPGTVVSLYASRGDGSFAPAVDMVFPWSAKRSAMADFNRDGLQDVLVEFPKPDPITVLLSNGDGTFERRDSPSGPSEDYGGFAVADLNGDGFPDLSISTFAFAYSGLEVLLGRGDGTFAGAVHHNVGGVSTRLIAGDFNGDERVDLISTRELLLGDGNGGFSDALPFALGGSVAADFDGDGNLDLLGAAGSGVAVFRGHGDASFVVPRASFATNWPPEGMVIADLNGDGWMDVATAGRYGVSILINKTGMAAASGESAPFVDITVARGSRDMARSHSRSGR